MVKGSCGFQITGEQQELLKAKKINHLVMHRSLFHLKIIVLSSLDETEDCTQQLWNVAILIKIYSQIGSAANVLFYNMEDVEV